MFGHLSILECFVGNLELGEVTGHQAESLSDRAKNSCVVSDQASKPAPLKTQSTIHAIHAMHWGRGSKGTVS